MLFSNKYTGNIHIITAPGSPVGSELRLLSGWSFTCSPNVLMVSSGSFFHLPKHANSWIAYAKSLLGLSDQHLIQYSHQSV